MICVHCQDPVDSFRPEDCPEKCGHGDEKKPLCAYCHASEHHPHAPKAVIDCEDEAEDPE